MQRILHLSDTHVPAAPAGHDGPSTDDALAALDRLLHDIRHVRDLDLIVVSGDIADDGSTAGCTAVRDRIADFAAARRVPQIYSTGNHDDRAAFRAALGSGHIGRDGTDIGNLCRSDTDLRAAVSTIEGLRVVTLDSLVPGQAYGSVDGEQLEWLSDVLSRPAEAGTVLVFHHPPLSLSTIPFVEHFGLRHPDGLGQVITGRDVRAILTGHLHFQALGFLAGVPVWVTPGVASRIDPTAPPYVMRAVRGASASVVDLTSPSGPTFHVLQSHDPRAGEYVDSMDTRTAEWTPQAWAATVQAGR